MSKDCNHIEVGVICIAMIMCQECGDVLDDLVWDWKEVQTIYVDLKW